jgi:ELWxxDGT repeat protein
VAACVATACADTSAPPARGESLLREQGGSAPLTSETPFLVSDLYPGAPAPNPWPTYPFRPDAFVSLGGTAFFLSGAVNQDVNLWRTDGTAAGTRLVRDLVPGPAR